MYSRGSASLPAPPRWVIEWGCSASDMLSLGRSGPRFPCPLVPALVWDSQGLRKAQFAIFPQWWSLSSSLFPSLLNQFFFCTCCCQAAVWEAARWFLVRFVRETGRRKKRSRPTLHKPYRPRQLFSFVPHPRHPLPLLTTGSPQWRKILPMSSPALRK